MPITNKLYNPFELSLHHCFRTQQSMQINMLTTFVLIFYVDSITLDLETSHEISNHLKG